MWLLALTPALPVISDALACLMVGRLKSAVVTTALFLKEVVRLDRRRRFLWCRKPHISLLLATASPRLAKWSSDCQLDAKARVWSKKIRTVNIWTRERLERNESPWKPDTNRFGVRGIRSGSPFCKKQS